MGYSVKWVTEHLGITRHMLRHYEKEKLLPPNPSSQYRNYSDEDIEIIWGIKLLIGIGFSTKEIFALINDKEFDFYKAVTQKIEELEKKQQMGMVHLQFAKSIKLLGQVPTVKKVGTVHFKEFLDYVHKTWNFYDDPQMAPFMHRFDNLAEQREKEWSTDDMEQLLNLVQDAENMRHAYVLNGYYQVISDMKDLEVESTLVQHVVKLLHQYIIKHNANTELNGKITPQVLAKYTAPLFISGDIAKQYEKIYGEEGCLFIAKAIAQYGGYQLEEL